jgi:hypothetical protein
MHPDEKGSGFRSQTLDEVARFQECSIESEGNALCGVPRRMEDSGVSRTARNATEGVPYRLSPGIARVHLDGTDAQTPESYLIIPEP